MKCRVPKCTRKALPESPWCSAHFGLLVDRALSGEPKSERRRVAR